jgi:hypothetical protein
MTYAQFKAEWNGRRVDYDHVYGYQCVDLIVQWCYEHGIGSGVWGNAIDYANRPTPVFVANFVRVSDYKQGDVVVLYGLSGNPYGHIGLYDSEGAPGNIRLLEENGTGSGDGLGKSAIGVWRDIPKSRVAAIYRYKGDVVVPAPAPARFTVFLPADVQSWRLYRVGSGLRPNTTDQIATLAPSQFGGLTYKIEAWVGDYAVVIQTQMFGRGVIWVKGTEARIS